MATKAFIIDNRIFLDDNGDVDLPLESSLPHRFEIVDGVIADKYDGATDNEVRQADHDEAQARVDEAQAAWDALPEEERVGERPIDLPELDLPVAE